MTATDARRVVDEVLAGTPLIDGHNDLAYALRTTVGYAVDGLDTHRPALHTDIPRLRAGRVGGQFWSVFVPSTLSGAEAVLGTVEQVDAVHRLIARYPETFALACTAEEVLAAFRGGRIAALLGAEGGHSIGRSLGALRMLARLGVRYMTLTHNDNVDWADSATDTPAVGGLTDEGRAVVAEMNRIGMLVDLSHTAETTQHAALDVATSPVIFSHSSCRAVCDHPRNATDAVLERLATNGGVLQVTFVPKFVSPAAARWTEEAHEALGGSGWHWARAPRAGEAPAAVAAENVAADPEVVWAQRLVAWEAEHPRPRVGIADVVAHVEHAREVAGVGHIGLGGDYDGVDRLPDGLEDVSGYPRLLEALADRGWSGADLAALAGGNVLRVLRDADDAATETMWPRG
ncbi:dipeptidase [Georgenia yuyongxinii]|uniref:Membrane dipeptidase n=1 Tax=Georgenia yuyongxinii TaxID=2589797 RepID=A0A552WTQ8_9MICO|nr:dipeptidase [Georgenia yuyongxinii]TRW46137.1 membrane dipeptidase [Georgenia yuyongxinii]